jgi:tRNA-splicing endonuclease subunit Sen34
MVQIPVREPFPIFKVAERYLLFDIDTITYIRREYHICGVLIGNIPQATQQTVFSGIPVELMPEEARFLVEKGHAFIISDIVAHEKNLSDLSKDAKKDYLDDLKRQGMEAAEAYKLQSVKRKQAYFARVGGQPGDASDEAGAVEPMQVTPTTSYPPLEASPAKSEKGFPQVSSSYPLFAHLHERGYFQCPGLRFGCQYVAYPGDPLRFHSHFLVTSHEWDEEIDLLDIVGGGRLGTGVKKGYMIGGAMQKDDSEGDGEVRTFSIEWAAM